MKSALAQGLVDEDCPAELDDALSPDSGYGGSIVSSYMEMNKADEEFEVDLRKKQAERPLEEIFKPLTVDSATPSVRKKSLTDPARLLRKLFVREVELVQAASDGDIDKVARLLSLGCNVNARDRWGLVFSPKSDTCLRLMLTKYHVVGQHSACARTGDTLPSPDSSWSTGPICTTSMSTATPQSKSLRPAATRRSLFCLTKCKLRAIV